MTIPVVVITHGRSAPALCDSARMIIGEQEELYALEFLPGENVDTIVSKINALSLTYPSLFLVDFLGGSPFNAAAWHQRQLSESSKGDVVTGVNIPMLINVLMERQEYTSVHDLSRFAKETGSQGIICMSTDFQFANSNEEEL
ncbi:mannose-specific PTS system EIIAB component [Citrobacter braakii]|uniref:PTS sugar transporter subunit IIA domain-containing protein n=1 Tax=Citrobacter braakii TaxID=57706 RepID=UPI000E13AB99|nr:PTS N'-diacetylchitobiose transporter subunit IIB [Citrobacter braakii]QXA94174.1 PTS N'-diacetylchitobiose transporter subunit IIB [Citrobacter braakii]STB40337.1 mannose-specific PTS system EIIAB component [Citrobacter braakii]SUX59710.1 mannose-specific PTS system EIIAB component [Citrobacter braakii]HCZ8663095.1 PTS N'-diacetylchitobiose transporter subunit IIB [Citrobacter braakii]